VSTFKARLRCLKRWLFVVLETLSPAERVAFVLHDVFGCPFEEIAEVLDRSVDAARQLASRGRRRLRRAPNAVQPEPRQCSRCDLLAIRHPS
jgi:RNA polymerase sigma-70 factor (ECF subfamily)